MISKILIPMTEENGYWNEAFYNGEKVQRSQLHANLKEFALVCICEAISVYLTVEEKRKTQQGRAYNVILYLVDTDEISLIRRSICS
jgi:hypothetical protein